MGPPKELSPILEADHAPTRPDLASLAAALEGSWDHRTAYGGVTQPGNPALGQCYPTSRVVQFFYPETEIACGDVWTGSATECHFWNVRNSGPDAEWIDLTWQQFPPRLGRAALQAARPPLLGRQPAVRNSGPDAEWIDLTWQQFPPGSVVRHFKLLDRHCLEDSPPTVERCALLLRRVLAHLAEPPSPQVRDSGRRSTCRGRCPQNFPTAYPSFSGD
jgi:hypothetical protein